jgi:NAD(P)-dependent dehydrogenase (short-subunit alcohol dehydrogenase family)
VTTRPQDRYGERVATVALDVTDYAAAGDAVQVAVERFGRLDVVVNNAGYADLASVEDITIDAFRAQIDTNLLGVVNVTKAALPVLREQGSGHIIQISSLGGRIANAGLSAYQAAKFAVGGFSEALAQDRALGAPCDGPRAGRHAHRLGRLLDDHPADLGALRAGDPAKVAQVVLKIAAMEKPPLRLLVGSDALAYAKAAADSRTAADATWRELSISTDHDDVDAATLDPLGQPH